MRTIKKTLWVIGALIGVWCSAQQGLNYKAIIKDSNGNVVANQNIDVEFTILQGQTVIYKEENSTFSNDIGAINLLIGNGDVLFGNFSTINWESVGLKLNVQVNTGNGLKDMGSAFFGSVPYAKQAEKALNVSGLQAIDEGNGIGWRLVGRDNTFYGPIGENAVDFSYSYSDNYEFGATGTYALAAGFFTRASGGSSFAMGLQSRATGSKSAAIGSHTLASGSEAMAFGDSTEATGWASMALCYNTLASGFASMAIGDNTLASGSHSFAMGRKTKAEAGYSVALGRYNKGGAAYPESWFGEDPLLEVGNGSGEPDRNNAFTILKNGNIGVQTHLPQSKLHITGGVDANLNDTSGYLTIGSTENINLVLDNNEILARNNGSNSTIYIQTEGGATSFGGSMYLNGELLHSSDRRLKTDIEDLQYGLNEILALQPKAYHWKNKIKDHKSLGLIAQEVKDILEELVITKDDENGTLAVNYTELIPILINAIKEQQETIKELKSNNEDFKTRLEKIETLVFSNN